MCRIYKYVSLRCIGSSGIPEFKNKQTNKTLWFLVPFFKIKNIYIHKSVRLSFDC